jgi:hypothetical protein
MALQPGASAPPIPGVDLTTGPTALFFFKVTCPVCQMTAPKVEAFDRAYPGRITGVGQDPEPRLDAFGQEFSMTFGAVSDAPPYDVSNAYEIEVVPTLFVVDRAGSIVDTVESWDRDGYNRASETLAGLTGVAPVRISETGDGLPPFRPG